MELSDRTKEALKTALAMVIAYGIGLQAGWDRPYWAGFAVAFISLDTIGQSLNKGALRMTGTIMGAIIALAVIDLTAQFRWLFILYVSLWVGLCAYMMGGSRHQYFWHVSGFVFLIICIDGGPDPEHAFATAMLRLQQTGLGILSYSLVAMFLWPRSSSSAMLSTAEQLVAAQSQLIQSTQRQLTHGEENIASQDPAWQGTKLAEQFAALLDAAMTDSDEIREQGKLWREFQSTSHELSDTLQRLQENHRDLQSLPLQSLLPRAQQLVLELESRLDAVQSLLYGDTGERPCIEIELAIDEKAAAGISHFQRAALRVGYGYLLKIDQLTHKLHDITDALQRNDAVPGPHAGTSGQPARFTLDPDRLLATGQVIIALWLAFLASLYIADFPGGLGIVTMTGPIAMVLFNTPQMPISATYLPVANGIGLAAVLYLLVMPQLSSFLGLGLMIFSVTFYICYRYHSPQQGLGRAFGLAMFVVIISVSNEQSYSFISVADTALMMALLFTLLNVVSHLPFSPQPELAVMRLLRRYLRSAHYLLSQPAKDADDRMTAWQITWHQQEINNLPARINARATFVSPARIGEDSAGTLPLLVGSLQLLTYRQQELHEMRRLPQSPRLSAMLFDTMQHWRFHLLANMQAMFEEPGGDSGLSRDEFHAAVDKLEERIAQALNDVGDQPFSDNERDNFYRLLGAYRGTSEALLDFAELAGNVDWASCQEERFA